MEISTSIIISTFFSFLRLPCGFCDFAEFEPIIYTPSEYFKSTLGNYVELQCAVSHADQVTSYFWSRENIISYNENCHWGQSCQTGRKDGNVFFLAFNRVELKDQGVYKCQIFWNNTIATLNHTLMVLMPPKVHPFETTEYSLKEGESVSVTCEAEGIPEPVVTWSKFDPYDYDSGWIELEAGNNLFAIDGAVRADATQYKCSASNEIGLDEQEIVVNILFKPEASAPYDRSYCGVSYKCTLECTFNAYETAVVTWSSPYIDLYGMPVHWKQEDNYGVSTLTIPEAKEEHLGTFSCIGSNSMGTDRAKIELTFKPTTPNITSLYRRNYYSDRYFLEWTVTSFAKLMRFEAVFYLVVNETTSYYLRNMTIKARDFTLPLKYQSIRMPIVSPNYIHSEMLSSLSRDSKYSVQMRALNNFGYSDWTLIGYFWTAKGYLRSGSSTSLLPTTSIVICALLTRLF